MKINTPTGTMTLADDTRPSVDDQNDIIASVTRDDAEFQAACDAAQGFDLSSQTGFHRYAAAFIECMRRESTTSSIGIRKWSQGMSMRKVWETGRGDDRQIGWQRIDGCLAIETHGDPVFDTEQGFGVAWSLGRAGKSPLA